MDPVAFVRKGRAKFVRRREEDSESEEEETLVKSKKVNYKQKYGVTASTYTSTVSSSGDSKDVSVDVKDSIVSGVDSTVKSDDQTAIRPGPVQAKHLLPTTFIDYAPDVCKDYKQTGFCGFGDTCKFLHDREDYKAGWQLDREWEEVQHKKREAILHGKEVYCEDTEDSSSEEEDIPFACFICKKEYVQPIVTKCGHYFCEACAIQRYKKKKNCIICGAGTFGIFNAAKKLELKLLKKKSRSQMKSPVSPPSC